MARDDYDRDDSLDNRDKDNDPTDRQDTAMQDDDDGEQED